MQTTGRIAWIDELKGFLMLVVIAGHCPLIHYIPYYGVVGQCFMAAFYFLSGYTYRDRGELFSSYCGKRTKRLLIPYAVWGAALVAQDTVRSLLHGIGLKTILLHKWGGLIYCRYMLCASSYTSGGGGILAHFQQLDGVVSHVDVPHEPVVFCFGAPSGQMASSVIPCLPCRVGSIHILPHLASLEPRHRAAHRGDYAFGLLL